MLGVLAQPHKGRPFLFEEVSQPYKVKIGAHKDKLPCTATQVSALCLLLEGNEACAGAEGNRAEHCIFAISCIHCSQGLLCDKQPAKPRRDQQQGSLQRSTDKQSNKAGPDTCLHDFGRSLPEEPDSLMRNQACFLKCWKRDSASAAALGDTMRSNSCLTGLKVCPNTPCRETFIFQQKNRQ